MRMVSECPQCECLLIGDMRSGKSAFLSRLTENKYVETLFPTNFIELATKFPLVFWDCSGNQEESSRKVLRSYYSKSDIVLIFIDVNSQAPKKEITDWLSEIANEVGTDVPVRIMGTKSDEVSDENELQRKNEQLHDACQQAIQEQNYFKNVSFLGCCSAKNNEWIGSTWTADEAKQEMHTGLLNELRAIAFPTIPQSEEKSLIQESRQNTMRRARLKVSQNPRSFLPFFAKRTQRKNNKRFSNKQLALGMMAVSFMPVPLLVCIALKYAIGRRMSQPIKREKHACGIELAPMA